MVSYADATTNTFVPALSNGTLQDTITMLNLPYVKVMSKFGSESLFLDVAAIKGFSKVLQQMHDRLVVSIKAAGAIQAVQTATNILRFLNGGYDRLLEKMSGSCLKNCASEDAGCRDGCSVRVAFLGMLEPFVRTSINETDAIPLDKFQQLANETDSMSFMNTTEDAGVFLWVEPDAPQWKQNRQRIMDHFQIGKGQFMAVHSWLQSASNTDFLQSQIFNKLNSGANENFTVSSWDDVVYRQWLRADVLAILKKNDQPIMSVKPESPPEFAFYLAASGKPPLETWNTTTVRCLEELIPANATWSQKTFLNYTMTRPGKREDFTLQSLDARTSAYSLEDCFPTSMNESSQHLADYFHYLGQRVVSLELDKALGNNSGILATRTVQEHVFGYQEPILNLVLDDSDPRWQSHALLPNDASLDDTPYCRSSADVEDDYFACTQERIAVDNGTIRKRYIRTSSTYSTGKDGRYGEIVSLRGQDIIQDVFVNGDLVVRDGAKSVTDGLQSGYSAALAFPPFRLVGFQFSRFTRSSYL